LVWNTCRFFPLANRGQFEEDKRHASHHSLGRARHHRGRRRDLFDFAHALIAKRNKPGLAAGFAFRSELRSLSKPIKNEDLRRVLKTSPCDGAPWSDGDIEDLARNQTSPQHREDRAIALSQWQGK
jgi:hypothetical protein